MFIKNKTKTWQSFMLGDKSFRMQPFGTIQIDDSDFEDGVMKLLLSRDVVEVVDDEKGIEEVNEEAKKAEAKAEENKIPVSESLDSKSKTEVATMVQCSAHNKNGNRCNSKVKVNTEDFDPDKPYFCGRHANENPAEYEKIDGVFVKVDRQTEEIEEVSESADEKADEE